MRKNGFKSFASKNGFVSKDSAEHELIQKNYELMKQNQEIMQEFFSYVKQKCENDNYIMKLNAESTKKRY